MLAIEQNDHARKFTPNLLPCRIHHSAPLKISKRYWSPTTDSDGKTSTSYFRGRKLKGRTVKLPKGYQGYLLQKTDKDARQTSKPVLPAVPVEDEMGDVGEDDERPEEVKVMQQKAVFDEIMIWGHETAPGDGDEYIKGVEEWIAFAEAMHTEDTAIRKQGDSE